MGKEMNFQQNENANILESYSRYVRHFPFEIIAQTL